MALSSSKKVGTASSALFAVFCLVLSVCFAAGQTSTPSPSHYQQLARAIFQELVEIKSTESGVGSTPAAEAMSRRLLTAGFLAADVLVIGPAARKKNLVARLHGKGKDKPLLLLAHLDVVEARREDWSPDLDPFRFVEREGYFYGRGTQDIKDCAAILVTNFIRWKEEGWVPDRDLILALTADEERSDLDDGIRWLLENHRELIKAEYALNPDSGDFQSKDGKPYIVTLAAAEKEIHDSATADHQPRWSWLVATQGQRHLRAHRGPPAAGKLSVSSDAERSHSCAVRSDGPSRIRTTRCRHESCGAKSWRR